MSPYVIGGEHLQIKWGPTLILSKMASGTSSHFHILFHYHLEVGLFAATPQKEWVSQQGGGSAWLTGMRSEVAPSSCVLTFLSGSRLPSKWLGELGSAPTRPPGGGGVVWNSGVLGVRTSGGGSSSFPGESPCQHVKNESLWLLRGGSIPGRPKSSF